MVVNLKAKKRLVARVTGVGIHRIRFDTDHLTDIADAIELAGESGVDPKETVGSVAGGFLTQKAGEILAKYIRPMTTSNNSIMGVGADAEYNGCPMKKDERILMNFPGANRDPAVFENPDEVILDRQLNRHVAFGAGIHRCAGSNLARMELRVAIETWLERIPDFEIADESKVTWAGGQVRGPRTVPVRFPSLS